MFNAKRKYVYPNYWNDEDKGKFKIYMEEAKRQYPNLEEDMIQLCVERQINEDKGLLEPIDHSKIRELEIETPNYEEFKTEIDD